MDFAVSCNECGVFCEFTAHGLYKLHMLSVEMYIFSVEIYV